MPYAQNLSYVNCFSDIFSQLYINALLSLYLVRTCSKLKAPPSGFVSPYICTISPVSGTYCDFECKYGYKMVGNIKKVHCGKDGKWDKDDKPTFECKGMYQITSFFFLRYLSIQLQ